LTSVGLGDRGARDVDRRVAVAAVAQEPVEGAADVADGADDLAAIADAVGDGH
jgi:hypothetical protein